jgi:Lon protease-like protein
MSVVNAPGRRLDVAVFPLLNAVLFPGVTLPLHIFEKRYRQMLDDIQARGWPLAVALATPENGHEFRLSTICGAGSVQVYQENQLRQSVDILVHGENRVKLYDFVQQDPYFVMEAEVLPAEILDANLLMHTKVRSFSHFQEIIKNWAFINPDVPDQYTLLFNEFTDFSELSDFFVFHFIKKVSDKQVYLNCTNPLERAEMLVRFLEADSLRLKRIIRRDHNPLLLH